MRSPFIALTALAIIAGAPALAADDLVVRYADLDLSTPQGQKALDRRIDAAARTYCGVGEQRTGTRANGRGTAKCVADARAAAREQMAMLIEKSASKGG